MLESKTENPRESVIETFLVKSCLERKWRCLKLQSPGVRGVPDRIVLAGNGVVAFVETKRPKNGRLSALQRRFIDDCLQRGILAFVVKDKAEVNSALARIERQTHESRSMTGELAV